MVHEQSLEGREKKIIRYLKRDGYVSGLLILGVIGILFGLLSRISGLNSSIVFLNFFPSLGWFIFGIAFLASAYLMQNKYTRLSAIPLVGWLVWAAVWVRTRNLDQLRDITTGKWTLGPDLDPFLFLRWSKYIVEHGSIYAVDYMRNLPLGFRTGNETMLHLYLMAYFHKIALFFGSGSVEQSAVLYPVVLFALTVIAFFLFTRRLFLDELGSRAAVAISTIATFFMLAIPVLLPRTIAGIPEKEASGFFFLFLSMYLFLLAWKSKKLTPQIVLSFLAGLSTMCMALVWGGYIYIVITIGAASVLAFILGQVNRGKFIVYTIWLFSSSFITSAVSNKYSLIGMFTSTTTGVAFFAWALMAVHYCIFGTQLKKYFENGKFRKIPPSIISLGITIIIGLILVVTFFGFSFIGNSFNNLIGNLVRPASDRISLTVAENRQPYFTEWEASFGPHVAGIALFFWIFFFGSVYLFWNMLKYVNKKDRVLMTGAYLVFLFGIIFSRYSSDSTFNGVNGISLLLYFGSSLLLIGTFSYFYFIYYRKGESDIFKNIDFGLLLIFIFFFLSVVSSRGAVRLIMVLAPVASIIAGYFIVMAFVDVRKIKDGGSKFFGYVFLIILIWMALFSGYQNYKISEATGAQQVPSVYTQQWQKAMAWVRDSTPENAVFGHWWDYGYWVQSIGNRATVLDGGNAAPYWNYLMGRYALTGTNDLEALKFLYVHNTTHFLIDSTDIGKYSAFSTIGSDENYDRASYIPTFAKNDQATKETKNSTIEMYQGGVALDKDVLYEHNGTKVFLPSGRAGLGAILIERDVNGSIVNQPQGIFVYNQQQYTLPLRYAYDKEFIDYKTGVDSGFFILPNVVQQGDQVAIDQRGALLYLSNKTVRGALARLYLYKEKDPYFELIHSEDDFVVTQIKSQNPTFSSDFVNYQGVRGPIRIWKINYPEGFNVVPTADDLSLDYPESMRYLSKA